MKTMYDYAFKTLRANSISALETLTGRFGDLCKPGSTADAQFLDAAGIHVLGWTGLSPIRPILRVALSVTEVNRFLMDRLGQDSDGLIVTDGNSLRFYRRRNGTPELEDIPESVKTQLVELVRESDHWAGRLDGEGDYIFDPRTPPPGSHFRANLLIGDRNGFPHPLLTTPKAVIDEWGRGSSRSHSDKQILATRWDVVPEENGYPVNRQFYLVEDGRQIFYSAAPPKEARVETRHSATRTLITYVLPDGLEIQRTFFVAPAEEGMPLAVEAQFVKFINKGRQARNLRVVMTGMFGFIHPGALVVDVIYTCVTVEPGIATDKKGRGPLIVAPRYTAGWGVDDRLFNITLVHGPDGRVMGPSGFCLDYRKFIGTGSVEHPQLVASPDNAFPKKGPAFFALTLPLDLSAGSELECQSFNGLISRYEGEPVTDEVFCKRIDWIASRVMDAGWGRAALHKVEDFQNKYRRAVQVQTPVAEVNRLVNAQLPFQIRYQTYVSRSFAMTQKGFRQIGFREIQDLFAALPFELAAGRKDHIRDLIGVWAGHVHSFGYADHQFYWTGVEPGRYSDDALWLFQAVGRFIDLTGDRSILDTEWPVAGEQGKRSLFETLKAILHYSGKISIGKNGLPLIDRADWNDTLNLDGEGIPGPEKETLYRKQVTEGIIRDGEPLKTDLSESIMNGFLLEIARRYMVRFAALKGEASTRQEWDDFGRILGGRLKVAWKKDFFARAYLNRPNEAGASYLGAAGDRLSIDPRFPGTYFLNSFSWPVFAGIASDEQIETMLGRIEEVLLTPVGIRLSSPTRFDLLMGRTGSGDYAYGDRENGGVFKHANLMGAAAFVEAAKTVRNPVLAEKLVGLAWKVLRITAPFSTFDNPYVLAGNPRFCTQYTNPATGEHIGPLLSGTAPWMWLTYLGMLGVAFQDGRVVLDPVLPPEWPSATVELKVPAGHYHIEITKPARFVRSRDQQPVVTMDGKPCAMPLPAVEHGRVARVTMHFA